jgi:hypothetical protein
MIVVAVCILSGCGDDTGVGCTTYNHIYKDRLPFHCDFDSISIFFVAEHQYWVPISHALWESSHMADSLIVTIHAYGQSSDPNSKPNIEYVWYSDSLVIWYAYTRSRIEEQFDREGTLLSGRGIDLHTCPSLEPLRIDYVEILHSQGMKVYVDENVR